MKKSVAAFAFLLIVVVLSVFWGANKGWSEQKRNLEPLEQELRRMIQVRVEGAYNLAVVAGRHMAAEDEDLSALIAARTVLEKGQNLPEMAEANRELTAATQRLCEKLSALPSVKASVRDANYTVSLHYELEQSDDEAVKSAYDEAALDYNTRLKQSASGLLARLTGVGAAALFE